MFNKRLSPVMRQCVIVIIVNLKMVCFGMGVIWPSPNLVKLKNGTDTSLPRPITDEEGSWIVSILSLSVIVFNFIIAYLIDRLGKKICLVIGCIPKIISGLLFTFASHVWMLYLGRVFEGISEAFTINVVPSYASEIASKDIRGSLGTIYQISSSIGILIMLSAGPYSSYTTLNIMFTSISILTTIPLLFLPETPYVLYSKGRPKETLKILILLRGSESSAKEEIKEYAQIKSEIKVHKMVLFKNRLFLKSFLIAIVFGLGLQAVGYNTVSFYFQTILEATHSTVEPEIASVVLGLIQLLASFCTAYSTDKFGRRPILINSLIGLTVGMISMGVFFKFLEFGFVVTDGFLNFLPLISLVIITFCFSAGMGSLYMMLVTEIFEGPARAIGVSSSLMACEISMFIISKYFVHISNSLGPSVTYWIFSFNSVIFCLFVYLFLPETKKKSFSEIQNALASRMFQCN